MSYFQGQIVHFSEDQLHLFADFAKPFRQVLEAKTAAQQKTGQEEERCRGEQEAVRDLRSQKPHDF